MKIAYVSDAIVPYHFGGKEKRLDLLARSLTDQGHEVTVYTADYWSKNPKRTSSYSLKAISPVLDLYTATGKRSISQALFFAKGCFNVLNEDFDVVDVDHMPFFPVFVISIVAWWKRKPMVVTWHEVWGMKYWHHYLGIRGIIGATMEWIAAQMGMAIISVSPQTTQQLHDRLGRNDMVITIPNAIDVSQFSSATQETRYDFLFVGRLLEHKHVDILIQAIAMAKEHSHNWKVAIVGNGKLLGTLQQLARSLRVEELVHFIQDANDKQVQDIYVSSRVLVLPSSREGFGLVVVEAWAAGLPVITVAEPENNARLLLDDERLGRVSKLEVKDIYQHMKELLAIESNSEDQTNRVFRKKTAKKYDVRTWSNRILQVYESVCKK